MEERAQEGKGNKIGGGEVRRSRGHQLHHDCDAAAAGWQFFLGGGQGGGGGQAEQQQQQE